MEENMLEKKENEVASNNNNSGKNGIMAVLIIIIIALIGTAIYFAFIKKDESATDNNGKNNQSVDKNLSGIYTLDNSTIYLYQLNEKNSVDLSKSILILDLKKTANGNDVNSGNHTVDIVKVSEVKNNILKWKDNFGVTYTFEFINDSIKLENDINEQKDYCYNIGVYNKTKNYSLEDFYEHYFEADKSLFASSNYMYSTHMKYTVNDKSPEEEIKLIMRQDDKDTVYIELYFEKDPSTFYPDSCITKIQSDGGLQTVETDLTRCTINSTTIDGQQGFNVDIKLYDEDKKYIGKEEKLSGTYIVDKRLTLEHFVYDRFDEYFK